MANFVSPFEKWGSRRCRSHDTTLHYDFSKKILFIAAKDAFYLISRLDGRVVQGKADSNTQMMTKDESDPTQLWVTSDYGQQLINVGTNLPFQAHEGRSWIWDEEGKVLIDARKPNKVANFKFIVFNISFISVSVI